MIRIANINDLERIDEIGSLIHNDFVKVNHLEERLKLDYVHIFIYEEECIKGFIEVENHYETTDIINIAVLEEYQSSGIATKLLDYILNNFKQQNIILEVNEKNIKAINFYKKNGFKEINRRKKYYNATDDAIIMERK